MIKYLVFILIFSSMNISAKPEFIAHRGLSSKFPENTFKAITEALNEKFQYIEVDVHMSKDNKVIVIHDETIDRTTNKSGKVRELTAKEIKNASNEIPTLEEILPLFKSTDKKLIIEVKNTNNMYPGIEKKIVNLVTQYRLKNVIYKSFTKEVLKRFKTLDDKELIYVTLGNIPFINLYIDDWLRIGSIFDLDYADYYQIHKHFLKEKDIKLAHKKGKKIIVWDVQDQKSITKVIKLGVDIIETDYPPASFALNPSFSK